MDPFFNLLRSQSRSLNRCLQTTWHHTQRVLSVADLLASLRSMWHVLSVFNFAYTVQHMHTCQSPVSLFPPRNKAPRQLFLPDFKGEIPEKGRIPSLHHFFKLVKRGEYEPFSPHTLVPIYQGQQYFVTLKEWMVGYLVGWVAFMQLLVVTIRMDPRLMHNRPSLKRQMCRYVSVYQLGISNMDSPG